MKTAVVFVHGFTGGEKTWGDLIALLKGDPDLAGYQFDEFQYPTSLNPLSLVTKHFWSDDPDIGTIGQALATYLEAHAPDAERLILIGHSMGGLAIQKFIIEVVTGARRKYVDRLTEVIVCGTPSGGLTAAARGAWFKNQLADMAADGMFVQQLRAAWKLVVDGQRSNPQRLARFRMTPIAGIKDKFVPQETSLAPFDLDEKHIVPGDHVTMVKPASRNDEVYLIIKQRLRSSTLTAADANFIAAREAELMSRIAAARDLSDTRALLELAEIADAFPRFDRELGLALLGAQEYGPAVRLLRRYLDSDEHKARPVIDVEAVQQFAIALSADGDITGAVAELNKLPEDMRNDPETQGIMAGRFKRQWLKSQVERVGRRAQDLYRNAFSIARAGDLVDQVIYNGINAAYMDFVLGGTDYRELAGEVLAACAKKSPPDYWSLASKAEAELLLDRAEDAEASYRMARSKGPEPRQWSATGQQALDIAQRKGVEAPKIAAMFANIGTA